MKDLVRMFPDATRKRKLVYNSEPDSASFSRSFWKEFFIVIGACLGFAVAAVVVLVIMGALKVLGVKEL